MTNVQPWELPLKRLCSYGDVSGAELAAVWGRDREPCETILLGKLLLAGQAAHLVSAISAAGVRGVVLLRRLVDDQLEGAVDVEALDKGVSSCRRSEVRKEIELGVGQYLDAPSASRLWESGYLRFSSWKCEDLERSLKSGEELSSNLLDRVKGWFLDGLAQQVMNLISGVSWLCALHSAFDPGFQSQPSMILLSVIGAADSSLKCLRAAAPLANRRVAWLTEEQSEDGIAALLCTRVLDWAFRRVEVDRPDVIFRLHWRMGSSRLLWDFLAIDGRPMLEDPDDVSRAFAVSQVLPMLKMGSGTPTVDDDVEADVSLEGDAATAAAVGTMVPGEPDASSSGRRDIPKRRRPRRKQQASNVAGDELAGNYEEGPDEESEAARSEWGRMSVRMMLEMGWRADTGEVSW